MNLEELITSARSRSNDTVEAYLWTDLEWAEYATDAEAEACRRARLIVDSTTDEVTLITLNSTDATYDLDQRVIFIKRAKLVGRSEVLRPVSFEDLDRCTPDWETETGEPRHYVPDMDEDKFRPYPSPDAAGEVRLTVVRTPLAPLVESFDEPEIKPRYHLGLVNWMLYRAYSKPDAETKNDIKAADHLAAFEAEFGRKSSAINEVWLNREHGYLEDEGNF